jgi:antitoxin ParD1/3/4
VHAALTLPGLVSKFDTQEGDAMAGRNFSLTSLLSDFVDEQVTSGRHQNASEVVREALRRYADDIAAERASIAVIEKITKRGLAEMARGNYTTIAGPEDEERLLERLKKKPSNRKRAAAR